MYFECVFDYISSRLQTSFEANMKEVELSERSYREKYAEIRNKLAESEASRENVQASAKQLELQHQYTKKVNCLHSEIRKTALYYIL